MTGNKPYTPVSCSMHSELELLIMHNSLVNMRWLDDNGTIYSGVVKPTDVQTRCGEEFLLFYDNREQLQQVRLDRIQHLEKI